MNLSMRVEIDYTNWKGIRRKRIISPLSPAFENGRYHPGYQWILKAVDVEDQHTKFFTVEDIHSWRSASSDTEILI